MKLSEKEIVLLIEVDASVSGRIYVSEDDSAAERKLRQVLADKGLIQILSEDGEDYIVLTEMGQKALAENE